MSFINDSSIEKLHSDLCIKFQNFSGEFIIDDAVSHSLGQLTELWKKNKLGLIGNIDNWLFKAAQNYIYNEIRKYEKIERLERRNPFTGEMDIEWVEKYHYTEMENEKYTEMYFEKVLSLLTDKQIKILTMDMEGYTNSEIAHKLEISPKTVKNEKRRYREIITKELPPPLNILLAITNK